MNELRPDIARHIIETVGANGIPPEVGFQYFTAGLDPYLPLIDEEYISTFIKQGGTAFKIVIGVYGGGKTHFLYCVRDLAWQHNFAVSYVSLSPGESPFHQLEKVYQAVAARITPPLTTEELFEGYEQGIVNFLRHWVRCESEKLQASGAYQDEIGETLVGRLENMQGVPSLSFAEAVKAAVRALADGAEDEFVHICQWLSGEGYDRYGHRAHGIMQPIDRTTALTMLRSLVHWVRHIGYSGLVILLDEAERVPSLSTRQRQQHLSNLRELIDACGHTNFRGSMIFYAVPDENFLEGRTQIYEALRQRVSTVFETLNPSGVRIDLNKVSASPVPFLCEVGEKLAHVYEVTYDHQFEPGPLDQTIRFVADAAYEQRFGDIGYKRLFVQTLIRAFHFLRRIGVPPQSDDLF